MKNFIVRWLASALALFIVTKVVPGIKVDDVPTLFIAVVALGLINSFVRPVVMFLGWGINCLTFGLFGLVVNVLLFWIVGSSLVPGFHVNGFLPAAIGSVVMGVLSGVFNYFLEDKKQN